MAIRRWSPGTLLNGQTFTDAPLLPGDQLSIGPVQFEVLPETERLQPQSRRPMQSFREIQESREAESRRIRGLLRNVRRASEKIQHLETEITRRHQESAGLISRVRQLEDQLQQSRREWAGSDDSRRVMELNDERTRSSIESLERQLAEQRQAYDKDRDAWLIQCKQVADVLQTVSRAHQSGIGEQASLAYRAEELDERFQQVLVREQALSEQQSDLERARREFDQQVRDWEEKNQQLRNELHRDREQLDTERAQWQQEQVQRQQELDERSRLVEEQFARLATDRDEFEQGISQHDTERRQQLDELVTKCETLQHQLDEAHSYQERTSSEWKQQQEESEHRRAQTQAQLDELQQQAEEQRQRLESELTSSQQQLANLRQQLEQQGQQAGVEFDERERRLETEWQRLRDERDALEQLKAEAKQLATEQAQVELEQRQLQIEDEWQKLQAHREELEQERAAWQEGQNEQIATLNARCDELTREIQSSDAHAAQVKDELDQLRQQESVDETRAAEFDRERQLWEEERHRLESELGAKQQELGQLRDQWQEDRGQAEDELEQRSRSIQQQLEQLDAERQQFEQDRTNWEAQCLQHDEWEAEQRQQEETISQRQAELDREFHKLAEQREAFEREQAEQQDGTAQHQQFEIRMSDWEEQRQREQAELDLAREQLESERRAWEAERAQTEVASDEQVHDVNITQVLDPGPSRDAEVLYAAEDAQDEAAEATPADDDDLRSTMAVEMFDKLRAEAVADDVPLMAAEDEPEYLTEDELSFSVPSEEAPVDTASILAKLGQSLDLEESIDQNPLSPTESHESTTGVLGETHDDGEDGSIQDYMTQLLKRVGSGPGMLPAPAPPTPKQIREAKAKAAAETQLARRKEETKPLEPGEFIPRAVAPEAQSNLMALRDVANTSARNAIDKHQRRSFEQSGMIFSFIGIVSLMVSGTMAVWAKGVFTVPAFAALVAFLVSAFCLMRGMSLTAKARSKVADEAEPEHQPKLEAEVEAPAILDPVAND